MSRRVWDLDVVPLWALVLVSAVVIPLGILCELPARVRAWWSAEAP